MKKHLGVILYFVCILFPYDQYGQGKSNIQSLTNVKIRGYVLNSTTREPLIGASIIEKTSKIGVVTDLKGSFVIEVIQDSLILEVQSLGFTSRKINVYATGDMQLEILLTPHISELEEVVIDASSSLIDQNVHSSQMSIIKLNPQQIKNLPTIAGETDVIKVMQLMPGIVRGNEGGSAMFVRGGTNDQNLVILDEATIYNISHLFGFFSIFNNDVLKSMTVYKGGFPANYGGRLSSILDIKVKEGDMNKFRAEGSIGMLSSKLTLQGPIIKNKMSFIVSGRRTYIDKILKLTGIDLPYYFYDFTSKVNYKVSEKNELYVSNFYGIDILKGQKTDSIADIDYSYKMGNVATNIGWKRYINANSTFNLAAFSSGFRYSIKAAYEDNSLLLSSSINDIGLKGDYDFYSHKNVHLKIGIAYTHHVFTPNLISTSGDVDQFIPSTKGIVRSSDEIAGYTSSDFRLNEKIKIMTGVRLSAVKVQGRTYGGIEPRLTAEYSVSESGAVKGSYSRMKQYMHLVSSSAIALPSDLWYPVTQNVKPLISDQFGVGYFHSLKQFKSVVSIEGYYKRMQNLIEYREGAIVVLNDDFEEALLTGKGEGYGVETLLQKDFGKLKGFMGYTLSWSTRQFDGLNGGKRYFAKFDRRHNFSVVGTYEITDRISFSGSWIYMSGSRFTAKVGEYLQPNASLTGIDIVPIYSAKNAIQMSPTHRLDLSVTYKIKVLKEVDGALNFGCYNAYNRASPYRISRAYDSKTIKYIQPGLFGFLPFVSFNFDF